MFVGIRARWAPRCNRLNNVRRRDRVKILLWDRNGFWLLIKRLEADRFKWPKESDLIELTVEQLHWLLEGINLSAMQPHPTRNYMHVG